MRTMTPLTARNLMERALLEIVDRYPGKRALDQLWEHFQSRCAYCLVELERERRVSSAQRPARERGHGSYDHLVPAADGGTNQLANLVLACTVCNQDRRDQPWEDFLAAACPEREIAVRSARIRRWVELHGGAECQRNSEIRLAAAPHLEAARSAFEAAVQGLRAIRRGAPSGKLQTSVPAKLPRREQ